MGGVIENRGGKKVNAYSDERGEERAGARAQANVRVQQVLVEMRVRKHGQPRQHRCHLEVQLIRLTQTEEMTNASLTAQIIMTL